jgi:PAS domain-containing protein
LFTSYLARAVMTAAPERARCELNLVDPVRAPTCCSRYSRTRSMARRNARPVLFGSCATSPTCAGRGTSSSADATRPLAEVRGDARARSANLILENVADPILVTDDQSNIIMMNDEAEAVCSGPRRAASELRSHPGDSRQ